MTKLADLIWKNAELLRGAFKENEYRKVILPFTILRRLDCVLMPTRRRCGQACSHQGQGI
jgi:type I restriction enzyme M protein